LWQLTQAHPRNTAIFVNELDAGGFELAPYQRIDLGRTQYDINMDCIVGKNDQAIVPVQNTTVKQRMHIAVQALTSRWTRCAISRMVIGPAPVMVRINAQRLAVIRRNRSSGVAKLMREPCFLPLKASSARRFTS
jgi:hypothetical protein